MIENKNLWQKPELIVLVRTKPDESVLEVCKRYGGSIPGPNYDPEGNPTQYDKCNQGGITPQVKCYDDRKS